MASREPISNPDNNAEGQYEVPPSVTDQQGVSGGLKDMEGVRRPFEATGKGNKQPVSDPDNNSKGQYEKREEKNDQTNQSAGQ